MNLRLDENLHLVGCFCLSNELNGGVVDKSEGRWLLWSGGKVIGEVLSKP